jgi:DNA-binding phage protein
MNLIKFLSHYLHYLGDVVDVPRIKAMARLLKEDADAPKEYLQRMMSEEGHPELVQWVETLF